MINSFLVEKYGQYVVSRFLTPLNEVIRDNYDRSGESEQKEVVDHLKSLRDNEGESLLPESFWKSGVEWGMDFSSWVGGSENKRFVIIGAEPHIPNNFQLVYDFGNLDGKSAYESAIDHYNRKDDIWSYFTDIFIENEDEQKVVDFLKSCYITDLCHIVPKNCGQINSICKALEIPPKEWRKFRTRVAKRFLIDEIKAVNPEYVILHGNASRDFFHSTFRIPDFHVYKIEDSKFTIQSWELDGFRFVSIPHLKGDMKNKLWKCKSRPLRRESAKKILNRVIK